MAQVGAKPVRLWTFPVALPRLARRSRTEILSLVGGALLWEALGRVLRLAWLPPLSQVLADLQLLVASGEILTNLATSLQALAVGFSLSLVVGLVVGLLMGRYRRVEQALDLYVNMLLVAPSMIFVPIFFAVFGLSDVTRVAVIFTYTVFVIIINTMTGIRTVDSALVEMARSFGASERHILLRILLPGALPLVFAGIRLGMGRAIKGMINSEMFITFIGLGALAERYGAQFQSSKVFAIAVVVLFVALIANWIIQRLDDAFTHWCD
jgi:NitT/TauT family transport system permease protein